MTRWSRNFGGARNVFTGIHRFLTSGRYTTDLDTLPDMKNGYVPAGTPIKADDVERTIEICYAFATSEVTSFESGATSFDLKVAKTTYEGSRAMVGMILGVCPVKDLELEVEDPLTITAVDRSNANYDVLTVTGTARTATQIAEGTELVEIAQSDSKYFVKVLPNALLPYDVVKDENAINMWGVDGLYCMPDGQFLTNRVPVIPKAVRDYMRNQDVTIRYSKSIE